MYSRWAWVAVYALTTPVSVLCEETEADAEADAPAPTRMGAGGGSDEDDDDDDNCKGKAEAALPVPCPRNMTIKASTTLIKERNKKCVNKLIQMQCIALRSHLRYTTDRFDQRRNRKATQVLVFMHSRLNSLK